MGDLQMIGGSATKIAGALVEAEYAFGNLMGQGMVLDHTGKLATVGEKKSIDPELDFFREIFGIVGGRTLSKAKAGAVPAAVTAIRGRALTN